MHIIVYFVTVPVVLLGGLLALSAALEPVDGIPNMRLGMAAKSVPTTTAEMAARSREIALAVEAEFKRRNPPPPVVDAAIVAAAEVKPVRKMAISHSAKRKSVRVARHDSVDTAGFAFAPAAVGFRGMND